jgi:hypothetical protein
MLGYLEDFERDLAIVEPVPRAIDVGESAVSQTAA